MKFELHNAYLAGQWNQGIKILHRIAVIGALGAAEISVLRGHYMFLSVWGHRIEWELGQLLGEYPENHDCFWPSTLPDRLRSLELRSFARPELIESGSIAHWILTAWSTNPRCPKLINIWPELDFSTSEVPPFERNDQEASMRRYVQDLYRDFEPIAQPRLGQAEVERLQHARINLAGAANMSPGLGSIYRPILARVLFCLGEFNFGAMEYQKLYEQQIAFHHQVELIEGGL
jgi:hypothetical protein